MANFKSYTDLEQSKKLAEILPIESADMEYLLEQWIDEKTGHHKEGYYEIPVVKVDDNSPLQQITHPCWSLAALLNEIPHVKLESIERNGIQQWICCSFFDTFLHGKKVLYWHDSDLCDNIVDACYDIILKLHN